MPSGGYLSGAQNAPTVDVTAGRFALGSSLIHSQKATAAASHLLHAYGSLRVASIVVLKQDAAAWEIST